MSEEKKESSFENEFERDGKLSRAGMSEKEREIILRGLVGPNVPIIGLDIPYEEAEKSVPTDHNMMAIDEVDALLRGLCGEEIEEDENMSEVSSQQKQTSSDEYEILRKYRERMPRLEIICDRLARIATNSLSNLLRLRVELNPVSIDVDLFGHIMRRLPVPVWISVLKDKTHNMPVISIIDSRLVFAIVELVMGGRGSQPKIEGREFTGIESWIIKEVDDTFIHCLNKAWSEFLADIDLQSEKVEINPQFACVKTPKTPCIVVTYEVELDTSLGAILLVIPLDEIENLLPLLQDRDMTLKALSLPEREYFELCERRNRKAQEDANKYKNIESNKKYFQSLIKGNETSIAQAFRNEHPQVLACIFSFLPPEFAAKLLLQLPAGIRSEIIYRMKSVYIHQPYFLEKIDQYIRSWTFPQPLWVKDKGETLLQAVREISPETEKEIRNELSSDY